MAKKSQTIEAIILKKCPAMRGQFYMIASSRGPSVVRFKNIDDVTEEARRLAEKHPGETFYILRAISAFETEAKFIDIDLVPELPF